MEIDLNCDLGEGCAHDTELMPLITSASIACGGHAGDPAAVHAALRLAAWHDVQVGAHPGYADRIHFGRRELERSEGQIFEECVYQIGAVAGLARAVGIPLTYVKPHGALYNQACRLENYARPLVAAVELFGLALMGLPRTPLEALSEGRCPFIAEGFADRRYLPDGALVPRSRSDALVADPTEAARQVEGLLKKGVRSVCVHGDNPQAVAFVRHLRKVLIEQGILIRKFTP